MSRTVCNCGITGAASGPRDNFPPGSAAPPQAKARSLSKCLGLNNLCCACNRTGGLASQPATCQAVPPPHYPLLAPVLLRCCSGITLMWIAIHVRVIPEQYRSNKLVVSLQQACPRLTGPAPTLSIENSGEPRRAPRVVGRTTCTETRGSSGTMGPSALHISPKIVLPQCRLPGR